MFRESKEASRHAVLKRSLVSHLSECVKAVQYRYAEEEDAFGGEDELCVALEAIFLHGLKENFFRKAKNAFSADPDRRPQPSFWPLLLVLSHRDGVNRIGELNMIKSEVGQCRAWIRLALNDSLLSSYLAALLRNMNSSKPYYSNHAFVRDAELLDVARRLLEGLESCAHFDLPYNSSLLNAWSEEALMSAGAWTAAVKSCPVAPGVDVAGAMAARPARQLDIPSYRSPPTAFGHMLSMNLDEAFNYVLSNTPENFMEDMAERRPPRPETPPPVEDEPPSEDEDDEEESSRAEPADAPNPLGNSIAGKTAWSADEPSASRSDETEDSPPVEVESVGGQDPFVKTPDLREVVKELHEELKLGGEEERRDGVPEREDANPIPLDDPLLVGLGFEIVSGSPSSSFDAAELKTMTSQLGALSREYGLDSQDYQCKGCGDVLGTVVSKTYVCGYTGQYFCIACMDQNQFIVPARVVHNWDFRLYPVSRKAAAFLTEFQNQPLIDMKKANPLIYSGVSEMAQLQKLRIQLNFLRAYLFTCREPVIEELQRKIWPREYLYEHVHTYSVSDLEQISNGTLWSLLQRVVTFAHSHVKDCWLCSQKGFICEVCNNPKILYPFDVETTYRCATCSSVFHAKCLNSKKPCPKCDRKKKRHGKSLVDAIHSNFQ